MSDNTVHKNSTPHGFKTPHRFPSLVGNDLEILNALSVQLYPTGRAWYRPENGVFDNFHKAINTSLLRLIQEGRLLIDQTFPDNENFTERDAELWEFRLGLITNDSIDIEIRRGNILRKLGYPNNVRARQNPGFIESQLRSSGFDVYVHENTFPYKTPNEIAVSVIEPLQHGRGLQFETQHGQGSQHGGQSFDVIANSILSFENFSVGDDNLWATFFIGGVNLGDIAEIKESRLEEFKELVLKLKPAHTVAFTFINYI